MERKVSRVESFRTSLKNQKQKLLAQTQVLKSLLLLEILELPKFVSSDTGTKKFTLVGNSRISLLLLFLTFSYSVLWPLILMEL
jgi:hypothetical protein